MRDGWNLLVQEKNKALLWCALAEKPEAQEERLA
jgi:hypothetical protein